MKNIILLFLLSVIGNSINQSKIKSGIITYETTINPDKIKSYMSGKREQIKKGMSTKTFDKVYLGSSKVNSTLTFKANKSFFEVEKKILIKDKDIRTRFLTSWSGGEKIYYSNSKERKSKVKNCKTLGECFIIDSDYSDWTLLQETKKIENYLCYKAIKSTRKKNVYIVAWYAPEIPVNFGPKGYDGLPGLVLELQEPTIIFKAKKIILNPKQKVTIDKPIKGIIISEKDFKEKVSNLAKNIFKN